MHRVNIHLTVLLSALVLAGRADAHNGDHTAYAIPISGITLDGRLDDWPDRLGFGELLQGRTPGGTP